MLATVYMIAVIGCSASKCDVFFPMPNERYPSLAACQERLVGKPDLGALASVDCVQIAPEAQRRHAHHSHRRHRNATLVTEVPDSLPLLPSASAQR